MSTRRRSRGEAPADTALRLSRLKAQARCAHRGDLIIGSDQVASCGGRRYGKPGTTRTPCASCAS